MSVYTSPQDGSTLDAFITNYATNTNYSSNTDIDVGEHNAEARVYRGLIQFPGLTDGTLLGKTIIKASLFVATLADYTSNARTMRVYRSKRDVVIAQCTWNIYSTGNNWETAGGFGSDDCEQSDIGSVAMPASGLNTWYEIPLNVSAIQDIVDSIWKTSTLFLKMDTENADLWALYSSNHATTTYRPKLVVEYATAQSFQPIWFD